jgi:hypothetical protein
MHSISIFCFLPMKIYLKTFWIRSWKFFQHKLRFAPKTATKTTIRTFVNSLKAKKITKDEFEKRFNISFHFPPIWFQKQTYSSLLQWFPNSSMRFLFEKNSISWDQPTTVECNSWQKFHIKNTPLLFTH